MLGGNLPSVGSLPSSRYYHTHIKHQGTILHELLPFCDDVPLQRAATFVIHLRHGAASGVPCTYCQRNSSGAGRRSGLVSDSTETLWKPAPPMRF